jgi:hypothetical protein
VTAAARARTAAALVILATASAGAQDSATVVPGAEYAISGPLGWLDRLLFGSRYRELWTDSVRLPVMRLRTTAGGLTPLAADTGLRAGILNLRAADDARFTYRLSNPPLKETLAADLRFDAITGPVQDLVSALHPGAALVIPPLARAAGARDRPSEIGLLAADSTLGGLSATFAGRLGYLQPNPIAAGAISTAALIARIRSGESPLLDTAAYLRERLFDIYVGEAELFPAVLLWQPRGEASRWTPEAHNRDLAFSRFDGVVAALARIAVPPFMVFGPRYDRSLGETSYQLAVDRQFLGGVDSASWDAAARAMQAALTDSAIAAAIAAMPRPWLGQSGPALEKALRARRDHLRDAARILLAMLAREPYIFAPASADTILAWRSEPGALRVTMAGFARRFASGQTKSVSLYLAGDNQVVVIRGAASGGPPLRIITGHGTATIVDSSSAGKRTLFVNDSAGVAHVDAGAAGARPTVTNESVQAPDVTAGATGSAARPVDGVRYGPIIWVRVFGDLGILLGGGVERIGYDKGYAPYRSRQTLRAGYAVKPNEYAVEYEGDFHFEDGGSSVRLDASRSGISLLKFYGIGNETPRDQPDSYYYARQVEYLLAPSVVMPVGAHDTIAIGPLYKEVNTDQSGVRYITVTKPFGYPEFREAGVKATLLHDSRDSPVAAQRGWFITATGDYFPQLLDAPAPFGGVSGAVSTYWTPGETEQLTLAVRAAGQKVWGPYPVFEAAYLGGPTTVRGLRPQRYAGDASAYGNLEARLKLVPLPFVVRWDFGVSGFIDVGRVFVDGEQSDLWHVGLGGGVWMLLPDRSALLFLSLAHADNTFALNAGTAFIY